MYDECFIILHHIIQLSNHEVWETDFYTIRQKNELLKANSFFTFYSMNIFYIHEFHMNRHTYSLTTHTHGKSPEIRQATGA